jgi:hypothetical protein
MVGGISFYEARSKFYISGDECHQFARRFAHYAFLMNVRGSLNATEIKTFNLFHLDFSPTHSVPLHHPKLRSDSPLRS